MVDHHLGKLKKIQCIVWFFAGSAMLVAPVMVTGCGGKENPPDIEHPEEPGMQPNSAGPDSPNAADSLAKELVDELVSLEWDQAAAEAVVELNHRYFALLEEADHDELDRTIDALGRLGDLTRVQEHLADQPSLAGLLAGILEKDCEGPSRVLDTLPRDVNERAVIESLFVLSATPCDSAALARTLERDSDMIIRLYHKEACDAVGWFEALPELPEAQREYRHWLRDIFEAALSSDEEALDRAQTLLTIHARFVRKKLDTDVQFRQVFLSELWPMFARMLDRQKGEEWGFYVCDPRVWDLLARYRERGAELLESRGLMAVDLLVGDDFQDCRAQVLKALECSNEQVIAALYDEELRENLLFIDLLQRELPGGTLAKALDNLRKNPADVPRLLREYHKLDDNKVLIEQLGPAPEGPKTWIPGYGIYYLGRKYAQGRDTTGRDFVIAAFALVEIVPAAKGASKGIRLIQQGVKKTLAKRVTTEVAEHAGKASARELAPWMFSQGHQIARGLFKQLRDPADVTDLVRFTYKKSGSGRETFKRLTGLEARVFMRPDRRVAVHLPQLVSRNHALGIVLRETAINAGFDTALSSKPGEAAVETGAKGGRRVYRATKEQVDAWEQHVAAWWLANATGTLDRAKRPKSVQGKSN